MLPNAGLDAEGIALNQHNNDGLVGYHIVAELSGRGTSYKGSIADDFVHALKHFFVDVFCRREDDR
jgi:hypothetical protein